MLPPRKHCSETIRAVSWSVACQSGNLVGPRVGCPGPLTACRRSRRPLRCSPGAAQAHSNHRRKELSRAVILGTWNLMKVHTLPAHAPFNCITPLRCSQVLQRHAATPKQKISEGLLSCARGTRTLNLCDTPVGPNEAAKAGGKNAGLVLPRTSCPKVQRSHWRTGSPARIFAGDVHGAQGLHKGCAKATRDAQVKGECSQGPRGRSRAVGSVPGTTPRSTGPACKDTGAPPVPGLGFRV